MQKVEGSNPFSRFIEIPPPSGISSFRGWAEFGSVALCSAPDSKGRTFTGERPYTVGESQSRSREQTYANPTLGGADDRLEVPEIRTFRIR
jgi:hypothetical protein